MINILRNLIAPLLSLIILVLGNGLFGTLVTLRLQLEHVPTWMIGLVGGAYYAGFMIGSIRTEKLSIRVGHIRGFAIFAAITSACVLLQGMWIDPWGWVVLRFIGGACQAGLFVIIESWLLAFSGSDSRGKILAIYMTAFYASQASGQYLLNLADPASMTLFALTAVLASLSLVPVCITRMESPKITEPSALKLHRLLQISPTGVMGCFCSGLVLGTIYGLLPLSIKEMGMSKQDIANIMAITIFGGMLLQFPVGYLSDRIERHRVLVFIAIALTISSFIILIEPKFKYLFMVSAFLMGGFAFTLYPISISHACDKLENKDILAATAGLLLAYSVGATIGPIVAPFFIETMGPQGIFVYIVLISLVLSAYVIYRFKIRVRIPVGAQQKFVAVPRTTPIISELDPRVDQENKNK